MSDRRLWPERVHRFLDGASEPLEPELREEAERYRRLWSDYAAQLRCPDAEVDRAVAARLAGSRPEARRLRWLTAPRVLRISPLAAAAALAGLITLSATLTRMLGGRAAETAAVATGVDAPQATTVLVRFELVAPQARNVALAGSFNGWSDSSRLRHSPAPGVWTITVPLRPGEYEYLFLVDGERWIPDPEAHAQVDDGLGNVNSVVVVGPRGVVRS